jgi:hypothetical protein
MSKRMYAVIGLLAGIAVTQVHAQNLEMVDPPQTSSAMSPARSQRIAAVGEPPISRWVYPQFVVYFEGSYVIHAVARRSAPAS